MAKSGSIRRSTPSLGLLFGHAFLLPPSTAVFFFGEVSIRSPRVKRHTSVLASLLFLFLCFHSLRVRPLFVQVILSRSPLHFVSCLSLAIASCTLGLFSLSAKMASVRQFPTIRVIRSYVIGGVGSGKLCGRLVEVEVSDDFRGGLSQCQGRSLVGHCFRLK